MRTWESSIQLQETPFSILTMPTWKTIAGRKRRDFYDENKNLVRVKVKDSLDIPWLKNKPKTRIYKAKKVALPQGFFLILVYFSILILKMSRKKFIY